jgi:Fur family transcriptional regulator, ferric uptake regulator
MQSLKTRSTKTKQAVERLLERALYPLTLENVYEEAKKDLPTLAYSTVYRIIQGLEQAQKVVRIDWRERGSRYEWADHPHHHHIVCDSCRSITDIDDTVLNYTDEKITNNTGYVVKHHAIELVGVCPPCQKKGIA